MAGARTVSPPAAAAPYGFGCVTDVTGDVLVSFGVGAEPAPHPQVMALAALLSAEGLLPPRGAVGRAVIDGHLLSVAGDRVILHLLYGAPAPQDDATRALNAVLEFEAAYKTHLGGEGASRAAFAAAPAQLAKAFAAPLPFRHPTPTPSRLFVHATVEPEGPGVLVHLRLRNFTRDAAMGVSVGFSTPHEFLRPAALYGTGAAVGASAVHLTEALAPGEKLLELRLEPQEPRTGPLSLWLRARDGQEVVARTLRVEVKFPRIVPPQGDPVWLARQVALREGDARDIWRLRFTRAIDSAFAFERAKEAVAREHPLKLLEFSSPAPAYHEAWYLARIEPKAGPLLVEVAVRGPSRLIEFRAATDAHADLLGVKAEYRRRVRELLSERFMGRKVVVGRSEALPPTVDEGAPHLHSALLMRHLQGEIGGEELWHEMRRTATGGSGEGWQFVAGLGEALGPLKDHVEAAGPIARTAALSGEHAQHELVAGLFESYTRLMAPVALAQTARMTRAGARLRTGLDRDAEAEAEAAED